MVVKVLLEEALKSEWVVKKFQQEIESLTRLMIREWGAYSMPACLMMARLIGHAVLEGTTLRAAMKPDGMDLDRPRRSSARSAKYAAATRQTVAPRPEAGKTHAAPDETGDSK